MSRSHVKPIALVAAVVALLLAACGDGGGGAAASAGSAAQADAGDVFSVTVEHKFGSTEITDEPQRVVSIGFQEHDTILALGVEPVAARYWFGDENDVVFPWAEDEAGDADPEILNMPYGELNYEKIAALRPDLILGVYSGITAAEYETLSDIAPTVAQTDDYVDFGVPWQDSTRTIGRALGRDDRAEELIAEVEEDFADAREAHPEFEERTVVVATYRTDLVGFFAVEDPRSRFFTSLGFRVPQQLDDLAGGKFFGELSREQAVMLDQDLVVWDQMAYVEGGRATIENDSLIAQLGAMQDGRRVFLEDTLEDAFAFNTVLSLPFVLEKLVPEIAAALAED